jgi:hypothetical protein
MLKKTNDIVKKSKMFKEIEWLFFTKIKPDGGPQSTRDKQKMIIKIAQKNGIRNFIETGTYIGETVKSVLPFFDNIYTIEINRKLYMYNKKKFRKNKNVKVILGNSYKRLQEILPKIDESSIFWLDAHYSGGITSKSDEWTPIKKELKVILKFWKKNSVVLIDDARLFCGKRGYPDIQWIKSIFKDKKVNIKIKNDVIIIK